MDPIQLIATVGAIAAQAIPGIPLQDSPYYEPVNIRPDLGMKVSPKNDRSRPFRFTMRGILRTNGVDETLACNGTVRVRIRKSNPTVAKGNTPIRSDCTWSRRLTLDLSRLGPKGKKSGSIRITARFGGNDFLQGDSASQRKATYGPPPPSAG